MNCWAKSYEDVCFHIEAFISQVAQAAERQILKEEAYGSNPARAMLWWCVISSNQPYP